jgi:hypothetical protein
VYNTGDEREEKEAIAENAGKVWCWCYLDETKTVLLTSDLA